MSVPKVILEPFFPSFNISILQGFRIPDYFPPY